MNDQIIALREREITELRLKRPFTLRDEHHFIALRVAIEMLVLFVGRHKKHRDVVVEQQWRAVERWTAAARDQAGFKMPVSERRIRLGMIADIAEASHRAHGRRRVRVIE